MIACLCIGYNSNAQQCGFENYGAILVDIIDASTQNPIRGLDVYLAYANGQPIQEIGQTSYDEQKSETCIDEYIFWENTNQKIKKSGCVYTNLYRQPFPNAGDRYICVVRTHNGLNSKSNFATHSGKYTQASFSSTVPQFDSNDNSFFIYVLIEDHRPHRKQGRYTTQHVRIPIAAFTDICKSNLDGNDGKLRNGQELQPIRIELKPNDPDYKAVALHPAFAKYLIPYYQTGRSRQDAFHDNHTIYALQKIELYDEKSLQLLQTIEKPRQSNKTWGIGSVSFANFYNELNSTHNTGFRVPAKSDAADIRKNQQYCYYMFNEQKNLYEPDTLLNNKQYTRFEPDTKRMFATNWTETSDSLIAHHYELKDRTWILVETEKHEKPKPTEPIVTIKKEIKKAKCYIENPYLFKPLQYFKQEDEKVIVDTFWIGNYGNDTARINILESTYFNIPHVVAPNQKLPIVYQRKFIGEDKLSNNIYVVPKPFQYINDYFRIQYNGEEILSGTINYMIVDHSAMVEKQTDSSLHVTISNGFERIKMISTFPSGYVKEYGEYYLPDQCKIGEWTVVDSSQTYFLRKEQHNKLFTVQVANADFKNCRLIRVENKDLLESEQINRTRFAVGRNTTEILINDGKAFARYPFDFESMQQEEGVTLYLIQPNETYLYNGKVKIPIDIQHQQYKLLFHSEFLSDLPLNLKGDYELQFLQKLKTAYPSLQYYNLDTLTDMVKGSKSSEAFWVLDFSQCKPPEKENIFSRLEADRVIRAICILPKNNSQYFFDNTIYIMDKSYKTLDSVIVSKAEMYGFAYTNLQASMSHNQFNFRYKSKIVNEDFIKNYNLFCEALKLRHVSLNQYANIKADNIKHGNIKK
jgi:hypothetical protein